MVFTEQQLQVKKLVDVQQDIEIDALNDGVGALSSTMQNGFTEAANNFSDIQNSLGLMNSLSDERYNGLTGSINALSNAMTQGFLDMGNTIVNTTETIQGQFNNVNNYVGGFENNVNTAFEGVQNTFYGMENDYLDRFNQVNANISDSINNFNEQITNELSVNVFSADTMIYNVSAAPVSSLTALGYDSNGKIIPVTVIANTNIQLPPSANYLYTDSAGTPYAGMADTAVSTNENLVTSHAVYNAVNDIWTDLNEFHNEVSNSFGDVQNSFNAVDSTFAGVQNQFNDVNAAVQNQFNNVNNAHNNLYQNVVDGFIDVWANFDSVDNNISNMNSNIQNQFNGVNNNLSGIDNTLYNVMYGLGVYIPMNYINSSSPVNYKAVENVVFAKGTTGNLWSESSLLGNKYYDWNSTTNTLTFSSPTGIIVFNSKMTSTFNGCRTLNQNIHIPNGVTSMFLTFYNCTSLNQNILIPNGVKNLVCTFGECTSLNQNILIPPSVLSMGTESRDDGIFYDCSSLNQNIYLYSDQITNMTWAFYGCTLLADKYIHIRSSIPLDTSNNIYKILAGTSSGVNWSGRIINDLPAPTTWPPTN